MPNYSLFSVLGIEIEYMLVDSTTLNIRPCSDKILQNLAGKLCNEVVLGDIAVSNELVMHVLELKNNGPKPFNAPIAQQFQTAIEKLQAVLKEEQLQFLPTGAHPWMNPESETKRWPHDNNAIYRQYDAIFNCKGHGWSNLQSMHLNLPFANDEEFSQLHNAIRLILPLLPALAASTPFLSGQRTGFQSSRLYYYAKNQERIPLISGDIIPEFIESEAAYNDLILNPMYEAIRPYDPDRILQFEWLNSRGAIPKFESKAIEIRILDSQECVQADIAIARAIFAILKHWQNNSHYYLQNPCDTKRLKMLYDKTVQYGFNVHVDDSELYTQWQLPKRTLSSRAIWSLLIERVSSELDKTSQYALEYLLSQGNLSERLLRACGDHQERSTLSRVYRQLGHCLLNNQLFNPA